MNQIVLDNIRVENLIYEIRGVQVMLDSDLAKLYCVETKRINEAIKNNPNKFPKGFIFRIEEKEYLSLKSKVSASKGGSRKGHTAFTEQGVYMLATILKSDVATKVSIAIINAFVAMRHYIGNNEYRLLNIESKLLEYDADIKLLQESFSKLEEKKKVNDIYFTNQIYDAYSKIKDIFYLARKELVIIDGYADKIVLDMIKELNVKVVLITKYGNKLSNLDIEKYNKQYSNLKVIRSNDFHDRYFILDKKEVYHCGTSINFVGSKVFSINILQDQFVINSLINKIDNIIDK